MLVGLRGRTRLEDAVGRTPDALDTPGDTDKGFGLVVVGGQIVVGDGPVGAQSVHGVGQEIVVGEPKGDPAVVVGASTQDPGAEPAEIAARRHRVGFALQLPGSVGRPEEAPGLLSEVVGATHAGPPVIHVMREHVLLVILFGIQHGTRFQEGHLNALPGQDLDRGAAAGAGTDDHDVVHLGTSNDF